MIADTATTWLVIVMICNLEIACCEKATKLFVIAFTSKIQKKAFGSNLGRDDNFSRIKHISAFHYFLAKITLR